MTLPKVSIVTITYNHENYILQTLNSFLNQKYNGPIELVIANDNAPDNTHQVIINFLNTTKISDNFEIKYTNHTTNKGVMPNFIWALQQATGKYIALCEGDDYWIDSLKLQKQIDFLENNQEFSLCHSNVILCDSNNEMLLNKTYKQWNMHNNTLNYKSAIFYPIAFTCTAVFRNNINYNNFKTTFVSGDWMTWILSTLKGKAKFLNETTAVYRVGVGVSANISWHNDYIERSKFLIKQIKYTNSLNQNISLFRGVIYFFIMYFVLKFKIPLLGKLTNKIKFKV